MHNLMKIENTQSQMQKGVLEYCILTLTSNGEVYTSDIIKHLKEAKLIVVEGTLCYAVILFILDSTVQVNVKSVFLSWLICLALFIGIAIYSASNLNIELFKNLANK